MSFSGLRELGLEVVDLILEVFGLLYHGLVAGQHRLPLPGNLKPLGNLLVRLLTSSLPRIKIL